MSAPIRRPAGKGWLALIGGGEFSFGETLEADRAWIDRVPAGRVGFLPTASGSSDYGAHFADYLRQTFEREAETIPVYRSRDARRGKNVERLESAGAVYLGGGVADELIEVLRSSPVLEALERGLEAGKAVVAIAAAAQALGQAARSLSGGQILPGLGWLPGGVVEPNFDPGHDRRLRTLLQQPGVEWGLGLPGGSALLLGPESEVEVVGTIFRLEDADGDFAVMS